MTKPQKKAVLQFLFDKYLEKVGFNKACQNAAWFGEPLVLNKNTGKWSNKLPISKGKKL